MTQKLLTIFSAPKPFTNPHIADIQYNALLSWVNLAPDVDVLLIGQEEGLPEASRYFGIQQLDNVRRNEAGTPLISSMFQLARSASTSPFLGIINTDILLLPDLLESLHVIAQRFDRFVMAGQRWNLEVEERLKYSCEFYSQLKNKVMQEGIRHTLMGSDYFIFPRECYSDVPDFAIGRAGWDNWMIFKSRWEGWPFVDASQDVMLVHQSHDYSHLANGQPHYRLPETKVNVRLAGGEHTIFTLKDATHLLKDGNITKQKNTWKSFWRKIEIYPLVTLHSIWLGKLFYAFFHPLKTYQKSREWLRGGLKID